MSDLSRLLDDVYRTPAPRPEPAWSTDTALDEVFANWIPGPQPTSSVAEPANPVEAPLEQTGHVAPQIEVHDDPGVVAPTATPGWSRADDDILPPKAARRRLTFRRR
jgi:hypothetical protein